MNSLQHCSCEYFKRHLKPQNPKKPTKLGFSAETRHIVCGFFDPQMPNTFLHILLGNNEVMSKIATILTKI